MKTKKAKIKKDKKTKSSTISRKEIRSKIQESVNRAISDFKIESPSKKTRKAVKKVSTKIAGRVKRDLKKLLLKAKKATVGMNGEKQKQEAAA